MDGDALVGCNQVGVAAQLRARFQRRQHGVVEDGKVFTCDEIPENGLLLAKPEQFAQADAQRTSYYDAGTRVAPEHWQRAFGDWDLDAGMLTEPKLAAVMIETRAAAHSDIRLTDACLIRR